MRIFIFLFLQFCLTTSLFSFNQINLSEKNIQIDISPLIPFYETLSTDEKNEQIRDWCLYGLLAKLNVSGNKMAELFKGTTPMRYTYLKNSVQNKILPGRVEYLSEKDGVLLIPEEAKDNKSLIGSLLDKKFSETNYLPEQIHIYRYSADISSKTLNITCYKTEPGKKFFTVEYNYFEKEIKNFEDFKQLIGNIDDILSVRWKENSIVLGGRKYTEGTDRNLAAEDIATLYQAYIVQVTPEKEEKHKHDYNVFINQQYEEVLRNNPRLKKAIETGKAKKAEIMDYIRKQIPYNSLNEGDENVGFSLDPGLDYKLFSEDLTKLANKDTEFINPQDIELQKFIDSNKDSIISVSEKVKMQESLEPILILLRKYSDSQNTAELRFADTLKKIEMKGSYQTARYDGNLKGTGPAMILFYTDLTAKLWALDYNGVAPKNSVIGFRTMSEIKVPKLYWDDFVKLSKTRLWFGVKKDGFEVYGKKVLFEPISTRVYAASSDPLFPGKESKPNFQSAEFLGWWDAHYNSVADFEPQYHKLNQIQKWSCILMILKEEKNHSLDFLFQVPVERSYNFENWYKDTDYLKFGRGVKAPITFLDRNKYNRNTECLPLFYSRDYPLMGQNFFLFGGVSLASKKDILGKLGKITEPQPVIKGKGQVSPGTRRIGPPLQRAKIKTIPKTYTPSPLVLEDKPFVKLICKVNGVNYGELIAEKKENTVKLNFEKGYGAKINDIVNSFVEIQESKKEGYKDERIFRLLPDIESAIRIENWKTYCIKSNLIKDRWLYINLNEQEKNTDYIAKVAGTEPDSDIFYCRLITQEQLNKLTKAKPTQKIF